MLKVPYEPSDIRVVFLILMRDIRHRIRYG